MGPDQRLTRKGFTGEIKLTVAKDTVS